MNQWLASSPATTISGSILSPWCRGWASVVRASMATQQDNLMCQCYILLDVHVQTTVMPRTISMDEVTSIITRAVEGGKKRRRRRRSSALFHACHGYPHSAYKANEA
ncbi:hypothetical protein BBK36DRAFT_1136789 [Trichoderma citrinoviride]|uniref:Uncharacterized protein n=1 Tax=Trichoderma citrinoviride TaxID=58853 RepID=A0A2T4AWA9_9HYPO|nr:hypothetical protein BBK36DRAFT_1136789 [Trichoderma citrinoviride]PTB61331.1 hypothetical protein BBK36DRAFT_1136789 [Trichoderma citrinoviride]